MIGVICGTSYGQKEKEGKDKDVVAIVNGVKITKADLFDRLAKRYGKTALEQMIEEILITQDAKEKKVKISKK